MVSISLGEIYECSVIIPSTFEINQSRPQHVFNSLDGALRLSIRLRVESGAKLNLDTKTALERTQKK